jgi:class 3 adenylate cyclase/CheY-like chemotaxis protein
MTEPQKTVTVLFTDLVDSTKLLGRLDAHRAESVRLAHVWLLREALGAHDGHEVKTLGDGIMAVFTSAGAALGCACAMQRAVTARHPHDEPRLSIRVGISAGDATESTGDWHGPAVVEASRLCGRAESGQILVSDVAALLARGSRHPLRPLEPMTLKGLGQPVAVRELRWAAEDGAVLRVLLAEDSAIIREGLARLLEAESLEIIAEVGDAVELVTVADRLRPDVVIADIRMPPGGSAAGVEAAEQILARCPATGVLLLSSILKARYAERLIAARPTGIGYLGKDRVSNLQEFVDAVRTVAGGGVVFDPTLGMVSPSPADT